MAAQPPLTRVVLAATSVADDLGYVALRVPRVEVVDHVDPASYPAGKQAAPVNHGYVAFMGGPR